MKKRKIKTDCKQTSPQAVDDIDVIDNGLCFDFEPKQKSQARHVMEKMYPEAFLSGVDGKYDVILLDSLQLLKEIGNQKDDPTNENRRRLTGKDLVVCLKNSAEYYLKNTTCSVCVILFDKIERVPLGKGETQENRDETKNNYIEENHIINDGLTPTKILENTGAVDNILEEKKFCETEYKNLIPFQLKRPYLHLDQVIPSDWGLAMTDRENTAKHIIAWIVFQMFFSTDCDCIIQVPPGKKVMIDGHCLDFGSLEMNLTDRDSLFQSLYNKFPKERNQFMELCSKLYFVPLVKEQTYAQNSSFYVPPQELLYFDCSYFNENGEADFNFFYYLQKMSKDPKLNVFCIHSVDTDILHYSLWYLEDHFVDDLTQKKVLYWKYGPKPAWPLYCKYPYSSGSKIVDINVLQNLITGKDTHINLDDLIDYDKLYKSNSNLVSVPDTKKTDTTKKRVPMSKVLPIDWQCVRKSLYQTKNTVKNLVCCFLLGGSDYTKGYCGITYEKIVYAFSMHSSYIGCLIEKIKYQPGDSNICWFHTVNPVSYVRTVLSSYIYAHPTKFQKEKKSTLTILDPQGYTYSSITVKTSSLALKNQLPKKEFINSSCLHLCYYIFMLNQLGEHIIQEPDLPTFGFGLKRESLGWIRKNVQKLFNIDRELF